MKTNLHEIQKFFLKAVKNRNFEVLKNVEIKSGGPLSSKERFDIYETAYWVRMHDSLKEDFPKICENLGDGFYENVIDFLNQYPSRYSGLGEVSLNFPAFIAKQYPAFADLAEIELATVLSQNSAWPLILNSHRASLVPFDQLEKFTLDELKILWNTSTFLTKSQMVFQFEGQTKVLGTQIIDRDLVFSFKKINNFSDLLAYLSERPEDPDDIRHVFERWSNHGLIYFIRPPPLVESGFSS
jgi:hypothetical protein